jgi:hypothetical protein
MSDQRLPSYNATCGEYFTFKDFVECGDTFDRVDVENLPVQRNTYSAIENLATNVLDPIVDQFGEINLTYGFCSPELRRHITQRISPPLDQHAGYELNTKGNLICSRGGFAVDFVCKSHPTLTIAKWILESISFDRLYYYGQSRPLHISYGPILHNQIVLMKRIENSNKLIPQKISQDKFLSLEK